MPIVPPEIDHDLDAFADNMDTRITATPTAFGLVAADATAFHGLAADFKTKLATAENPGTRTKGSIAAKNTAKKALLAKARQLIKIVNAYPPVTNAQRADLGLNPRDTTPTPVPVPSTKPLLTVEPDGTLRLVDETTPTRRGKPAGVNGAVILTKLDGPAPTTPAQTQFSGLATRSRVAIPLPPDAEGKRLWVMAQWYNERGELGPVSSIVSTLIAA